MQDLKDQLEPLINQILQLNEQAYYIYKPNVEDLIKGQTKDRNIIERQLDHLLDHCDNEKVVKLFKKLCRHYWEIDASATAEYIWFYKEM